MLLATLVWGFAPVLYRALDHVRPDEIVAHRVIWSSVFFATVIGIQGRLGDLVAVFRRRAVALRIIVAAALIFANWGLFIYAIINGQALQAGFAYYIFPIVAVAFGVLLFRERLRRAQWLALCLVVAGIAVFGQALGGFPTLSLVLAVTFALYGIAKRGMDVGPVLSVTAETAVVTPLAIVWIVVLFAQPAFSPVFLSNGWDSFLLILSGPLTGGPMILFSYAARRIGYATLGLIQYVNPTLQTMVAVLIFAEPFTNRHLWALGLIWVALAVYSVSAFRQERAARRAATAAGTSPTIVT